VPKKSEEEQNLQMVTGFSVDILYTSAASVRKAGSTSPGMDGEGTLPVDRTDRVWTLINDDQ
jgi:hypothetical protein